MPEDEGKPRRSPGAPKKAVTRVRTTLNLDPVIMSKGQGLANARGLSFSRMIEMWLREQIADHEGFYGEIKTE